MTAKTSGAFRVGHVLSYVRRAVRTRRTARAGGGEDNPHGPRAPPASCLEDLLTPSEDFVQRIAKMVRRLGELLSNLVRVFLIALLDLFPENLLQRPVPHAFVPLRGEVGDEV